MSKAAPLFGPGQLKTFKFAEAIQVSMFNGDEMTFARARARALTALENFFFLPHNHRVSISGGLSVLF